MGSTSRQYLIWYTKTASRRAIVVIFHIICLSTREVLFVNIQTNKLIIIIIIIIHPAHMMKILREVLQTEETARKYGEHLDRKSQVEPGISEEPPTQPE